MGKAAVLAVVAIAVGLLVYLLARPPAATPERMRVPASSPESPNPVSAPGVDGGAPGSPVTTGPIAPPRTDQEKERDSIESRRTTLYGRLHQDLGAAVVAIRPSDDDGSTLDLYAANDMPGNTLVLLNLAVRANVSYYGFRHIRFFVPNPPRSIEQFHLDAEASADSAGNWQTFKK